MTAKLSIQTPGIALNDKEWAFIGNRNVRLVVPVFGSDANTHDSITGVSGSFQEIEGLLRRNRNDERVRLAARVILVDDLVKTRDAIKTFLMEYKVEEVLFDTFISFERLNDGSFKEWQQLFKRSYRDCKAPLDGFFRLAKGHFCWQDTLAIGRSGEVLPCIAAREHSIGNLAVESIFDVLREKRHLLYRDSSNETFSPCNRCEFRYGCSSCSLVTERIFGTWRRQSWNCIYDPQAGKWDDMQRAVSEIIKQKEKNLASSFSDKGKTPKSIVL